jgi:hypothetical protein
VKAATFVGGNLVLGRRAREFLERQLHLVDQPRAAFRARAVELPGQFCDLQSLVGDQDFVLGGLGLDDRQFGFDPRRPLALGDQRRLQRGDVGREDLGRRHEPDYRMSSTLLPVSTIR